MEIAETMIALRIHATDKVKCSLDNGVNMCPYYPIGTCTSAMAKDALKHIEDLTAQIADKEYLIQQQTEEIQRLQRDVKKQQEKMIELAKENTFLKSMQRSMASSVPLGELGKMVQKSLWEANHE